MYTYSAKNLTKKKNRFQPPYFELKDWRNMQTFTPIDNYSRFISKRNVSLVAARINRLREGNRSRNRDSIEESMKYWGKKVDLNRNYAPAYEMDFEGLINLVNEQFIKKNGYLYSGNDINIFRGGATVLDYSSGEPKPVYKNFADFGINDMRNMDVWQPVHIGISNGQQRYNNAIPSWQRTMNIRSVDKSPEVFNVNLADRDALEHPVHGYNMSRILRGNYYS